MSKFQKLNEQIAKYQAEKKAKLRKLRKKRQKHRSSHHV